MNNLNIENNEITNQSKILKDKFDNGRKEWNIKIDILIKMIRSITDINEAQVLMLSYRHMITDNITELQYLYYKLNTNYDKLYKDYFIKYKTNFNLKLNGSETDKFTRTDLTDLTYQMEIVNVYLNYFKEVIKTLDNLGYAIKNRIQLEDNFIK